MIYTDFIMIWSARSSEYQWIQWSSCWSCRTSAFFQELRFRTWDARLNDFSAKRNVDRWTDFFWRPPGTDFWYSESWWKSMDMGYFFIFFQGIWGDYTYISYIYISSTVGWSLLGWIFTHYQTLILCFDFLRNWRETRWQRPRLDAFVTCCPGKPLESRCDMSHARRMQRPWELWGKSLRKWRRRPETKKHEESS